MRRSSIAEKYLDPGTSLGEVLFGLIMTLTFTLGAGLIIEEEGREGVRQLLIATIGCNIAWGIIDGTLYLAGQLFDRGRLRKVMQVVRDASDATATAAVANELDGLLENVTSADERKELYARIAKNIRSTSPAGPGQLTRADWLGGLASFWLVFMASLPAAIPFLLIDDPSVALRVSNGVLVALLFLAGYRWARYTIGRPWVAGLCFLLGGLGMVWIAVALGG